MVSTCNAFANEWMLSAPFKRHVERPKRPNYRVVQKSNDNTTDGATHIVNFIVVW
jgi:hypothetical protein